MTAPLIPFSEYQEFASSTSVEQTRFDGVVAAIRSYCRWHITPLMSETFTVDGPAGRALSLPTLRLVSVESVTENGMSIADVEWSQDGTLRKREAWTDRYRGVVVQATHGYAQAPEDLVSVLFDAVSRAVATPAGQVAETIGPFSFGASEGGVKFFSHELAILDRYRLPSLP